jgi:Methyltransferase domain
MNLRVALKRFSWRAFDALDRVGLHVLPKHYYTPVADRSRLRAGPRLWRRPLPLAWDLDSQLQWLRGVCLDYYAEVQGLGAYDELAARGFGPGYGPIESQVLHCFVRSQAPRRIVEIGGGLTSAIMARAALANDAEGRPRARITTLEPSPWGPLPELEGIELRRIGCQEAPLELFAELGEGDLLFVDSSHAVKTGSEVLFIYLELVPRLSPGVTIHAHDVYLPYLYSPWVLHDYFDPQETALVAALLEGNARLEVLCCQSALHHERPERAAEILRDYRPQTMVDGLAARPGLEGHFPTSLWLRTRLGRR